MRRDKAAWLVAMSDALEVVATAPSIDGARLASARVMEQVFQGGRPARAVHDRRWRCHGRRPPRAADADWSRLDALRSVYPMLQRLAKRGLSKAPPVSDFNRPGGANCLTADPGVHLRGPPGRVASTVVAAAADVDQMRGRSESTPARFWADQGTVSQRPRSRQGASSRARWRHGGHRRVQVDRASRSSARQGLRRRARESESSDPAARRLRASAFRAGHRRSVRSSSS